MLTAEQLPVQLTPTQQAMVPCFWLEQIVFPPSKPVVRPGQAVIQLNNSNVLVGLLSDMELTVEAEHGTMTMPLRNVASLTPSENHPPGVMKVVGHDGMELLGQVQQTSLSLNIVDGVTVTLHPMHILSLTIGEAPPTPEPTTQPADNEAMQPISARERMERIRQRMEQAMNEGATDEDMQRLAAEYQQAMEDLLREEAEEAIGDVIVIEN
ncbi:MAG: hypothetical protein ACYTFO_05425 [Planctomycetota bacterium]